MSGEERIFFMKNMMKSNKRYIINILKTILIFNCLTTLASGARVKRAVMMKIEASDLQCQESTITQSNLNSNIILTATVRDCDMTRPTSYSCEVQIWRIMKGNDLADNLTTIIEQGTTTLVTYQKMATIYGLGNPLYCESEVKVDSTRIFFLNRINDRLILNSNVLRITLKNLQNTQAVIEGKSIEEPPKAEKDPCIDVLCGFKATCQVTADKQPTCVCPDFECGKTNVFAPVCGSDGVTYASECRLRASQCWKQSRIRVASNKACAPVTTDDPCQEVDCGNSAVCSVTVVDDIKTARCECPTCDNVVTRPVCGSDQTSHRTECDLKRAACLGGQDILLVRRSACNPCEMYNEESRMFDLTCNGPCSLDADGEPVCCNTIQCDEDDTGIICANDGKTYSSVCAMKKEACRTARMIEKVKDGACMSRETTIMRGSVSIAADEKCPGGCDPTAPEFIEFKTKFEKLVNEELDAKNLDSSDSKIVSDFKINEVRTGSSVLVYSGVMTHNIDPLQEDHIPGSESLWAFMRLHDPASGAVVQAAIKLDVNFVDYRDPLDDFYSEDVCHHVQCDHGSICMLMELTSGEIKPTCQCNTAVDASKLPVTHACKRADNGRIYLNNVAVHYAECQMKHYFTFKDLCRDPPSNPCDDHTCSASGMTCVVTNGAPSCDCKTCEETYEPVCGSNGQTYKSECEMIRYNCLNGLEVTVQQREACGSPCDTVDCGLKQCIETPQGSAVCICPESCTQVVSPVCGSDGVDYDNECLLVVAACKTQTEITVKFGGKCSLMPKDMDKEMPEVDEDEFEEGSAENECGCSFGASCENTMDDEDAGCICNINCDAEAKSEVCGTNGVTYMNDCERKKAQCETQMMISQKNMGACVATCSDSIYGCCEDGMTNARGPLQAGCPENCGCNTHGSFDATCHPVTRQCSCKPGISGLNCDRCETGYWNFRAVVQNNAKGCMSCQCHQDGSIRDDCDQMTGHCVCKPGVTGSKCATCIDNGKWPTKSGCAPKSESSADSCAKLSCRANQDCAQNEDSTYSCQCASVETCDDVPQMIVCGTDGKTYGSKCLLRTITCRSGLDVEVQSEGTCKDFVKANEKLEKEKEEEDEIEEELIIPDLIDVDPTTTTVTITTEPTTTTATVTTIVSMTTVDTFEGSGESGETTTTSSLLPPDDEDSEDLEEGGSGDGMMDNEEMETTGVKRRLLAVVSLKDVDGMNNALFSENPELASEYQSDMETQMLAIMGNMPELSGTVESIKIHELKKLGTSVFVKLFITLSDTCTKFCTPESLQNKLNSLPQGNIGSFMIKDADTPTPDETEGNMIYFEGSQWPTVPQFGGGSFAEFNKLQDANIAITMEVDFKTFDSEGVIFYSGQTKAPAKDFISLAILNGRVEFRFDTGSGPLMLRTEKRVDDGLQHKVMIRRNRKDGMLKVDDDQPLVDSAQGNTHGVDLDSHLYVGGFPNSLADNVLEDVGVSKGLTGCISAIYIVPSKKNQNFSLFETTPRKFYRLAECRNSPCNPNPCQNSANCFITKQHEKFTFKCQCGENFKGDECEMISTDVGACSLSPCHKSGTCVTNAKSPDSYTCLCPPSRKGTNCEIVEEDDDLPLINGPMKMPGFAADSYISRDSLGDAGKHNLDIEIVFYSIQSDGLLLYNGQKKSKKGEFVSLNLRDGYMEFMFDLGEGPATLRSVEPISTNNWHVVKAMRNGKSATLTMDDLEPVITGESPGKSTQLNLDQPLYIGGLPDFSRVPESAYISTGLNGAIQKLTINGHTIENLMDSAISSYNVRAFTGHVCYRQPCQNEGTCIPVLGGYNCECMDGFSGLTCEISSNGDGVMLQDQNQETIFFDGKTAVRYNNHVSMRDVAVMDDQFEINLKTTHDEGLILFVGQGDKNGDYLALGLRNGRLHLRYDLGSGAAFIETANVINDGKWKQIKLYRDRYEATLQINDDLPLRLTAPPIATTLNSNGILWLGGTEDMPTRNRGIPNSFMHGFHGCIGVVKLQNTLLHLQQDSLDMVSLPTCSTGKK